MTTQSRINASLVAAVLAAAVSLAAVLPAQAFEFKFDLGGGYDWKWHDEGGEVIIDFDHDKDCLRVFEIEALLEQMYANLAHYKTLRDADKRRALVEEELKDIKKWERELRKARRKC